MIRIFGATDIGLKRSENQDYFSCKTLSDSLAWIVLCDGMGGMASGALASSRAAQVIGRRLSLRLRCCRNDEQIKKLLLSAVNSGNKEILRLGGSGKSAAMGTTVVACVISGGFAHIAHAGDSRAYIIGKKAMRQLTHDHSMVQEMVDSGRITAQQAYSHPNKNIITSALGIELTPTIDYNIVSMGKDETLLVCSDGLTNMVTDESIKRIVRRGAPEKLPAALIAAALKGGGTDNITVVAAQTE